MSNIPGTTNVSERSASQTAIRQSLRFWKKSFLFCAIVTVLYFCVIAFLYKSYLTSHPRLRTGDYVEIRGNRGFQLESSRLSWFLWERNIFSGEQNEEGITHPNGTLGKQETSYGHYIYPTPGFLFVVLVTGWILGSFWVVSHKFRTPRPEVVEYSGPYCVSCSEPIEVGVKICPKCNWSQPG